jgi:ubiquinone/menaquinone biosynthesis C-methylase UbiE
MTDLDWVDDYYDEVAADYDESRGGRERARAVTEAIASLVSPPGRCLDVAGGTGIVSAELSAAGWSVVVLDQSSGMLTRASERLPGRALRAAADRLPVRDASVDLVTVVWMLNIVSVEAADRVLAEAARVLRPGGSLVTTVDKELAHAATTAVRSDDDVRLGSVCAGLGLLRTGSATFSAPSPWGSARAGHPLFRIAAFRRTGGD